MKTLRFIGMALLAVVLCVNFAACSDDDEPNGNNPMVGEWFCYQVTEGDHTFEDDIILVFNEDMTMTMQYNAVLEAHEGTYTYGGNNTFTITFKDPEMGSVSGTFTITGDEAVVKYTYGGEDITLYLRRTK